MTTTGNKFSRLKNWNIEDRLRGMYQHNFKKQGYEERSQLKEWLYSRNGSQRSFFLPTWQTDLTLAQDYGGGTTMAVINACKTPNYDIQVLLDDGTIYYSQVTGDSGGTLTVTSMPAFLVSEVLMISVMRQVRYSKDEFALKYTNHLVSELKTTAKVI